MKGHHMTSPRVRVHLDEDGRVGAVEVEGHAVPSELEVTVPSEPIASFGDEEFNERLRPWIAEG
jgi:hypothetical protein